MNEDGNCKECGCHWSHHVNSNIIYVKATKDVEYDEEATKKLYIDGLEGMINSLSNVIDILEKQIGLIEEYK